MEVKRQNGKGKMRSNHAVLGTPYGELRTQSLGLLTEYEF